MYNYLKQQLTNAAGELWNGDHHNENYDDLDLYIYLRADTPLSTYFDIKTNPMVNFVEEYPDFFPPAIAALITA